jgi:DGQHR domain-containing protein
MGYPGPTCPSRHHWRLSIRAAKETIVANQDDGVRFQAIRFTQSGRTFYSVCLTGRQLLDEKFATVDKWTPSNPDGYQRDPSRRRFAKVAAYLRGELGVPGVLPQSVLLGLRGNAKFQPVPTAAGAGSVKKPTAELGILTIPKQMLPLQEVDGQHRLGGVREAAADINFQVYPVPAVICENSDALDEAMLFYNINTTSVKVPVDLAQRLIAQQSGNPETRDMLVKMGKQWITRATEIVDILNDTPDQPWSNYIMVPGVANDHGVRQNTLVRSLQPLLTGDNVYKTQSADTLGQLLIRYWKAIESVWPSAVAAETRQVYALMKSVGILTMHGIAPQVFEIVRTRHGKITEKGLTEVMESIAKEAPEVFWHSDDGEAGRVGTNHKAVRFLSDHLLEQLNAGQMASELL